ncbi:MAG: SAM-dependent chlorinase/fluorinase [Desulfobacterales bacterium]|nr:SAM-dependent chlorinase/fluorinase [Desulfobacterales bacterium]MBS3756631.1 SAM-dependent chlorinase/fluorinase [Desulfobacterales bacterium]
MPVISLTTDFGLADPYAGIMKGVIASICPAARVIDLTHLIDPQDVHGAAYVLSDARPYFPEDTVHVCVVDPGVGSGRRIVALRTAAGVFLAPDNGVLSLVLEDPAPVEVFRVENPDIFLHPVSRTFHGRDVFAPAAAYLASGMPLGRLGAPVAAHSLVRLDFGPHAGFDKDGGLTGAIIAVDRFGNLVSNITRAHLQEAFGIREDEDVSVCVQVGDQVISGIVGSYQSVRQGTPLAIIGSTGRLEISVNGGNAGRYFVAGRGDPVTLRRDGTAGPGAA